MTAVIPPGNESLAGTEADVITAFKESLAIEDEDAAAVHIEVGVGGRGGSEGGIRATPMLLHCTST